MVLVSFPQEIIDSVFLNVDYSTLRNTQENFKVIMLKN